MKPGGSTLNPYAAAYVPLSKREGHVPLSKPEGYHFKSAQRVDNYPGPQMLVKDDDLDIDMEMEYLFVSFSGLSHESINDVYLANNRDLDATVEMLTQLEIYSSEADQGNLPDTLDIGDVPETFVPSTVAASNQNTASSEASASSSPSSGIPNAPVSSS